MSISSESSTRRERGVRLYAERKAEIVRVGVEPGVYSVPSCSGDHAYTVYLDDGDGFAACLCPDYRRAKALGETCKHTFAASMKREYNRSLARRRRAERASSPST